MEWIIKKATELGVRMIVPVCTERTNIKLTEKSLNKKLARWRKISLEAAKQSFRSLAPAVTLPVDFNDACARVTGTVKALICTKDQADMSVSEWISKNGSAQEIGVFIGPEGGFTEKEFELARQRDITSVSLCARRLRSETAALAALSALLLK